MGKIEIPNDYVYISDIEEIKKLLRYMLREYHALCEKNGLFYNVFGGTMLGAVRHQGMIPWDNDIDVTMPRPDYEKFVRMIKNSEKSEFDILCYPQKNYSYPFAKLVLKNTVLFELPRKKKYQKIGLYIDIFPVDGYPIKNEKRTLKKLDTLKYLREQAVLLHGDKNNILIRKMKEVLSALLELPGVGFYLNKEIKIQKKTDYEKAEYVFLQGAGWGEKGKIKKSIYLNRKEYEFDGFKVWGIEDYDQHLSRLYGDYMQPPALDKRTANHDYELYVQDKLVQKILGRNENDNRIYNRGI